MAKRVKRGFTLAEVLLVVSIISILLAIAAPNIIEYARRVKLAELDDGARSIFVAAQSRLTALHAAGEDFSELEGKGNRVELHSAEGTGVPALLFAANDTDGETGELIPAGSIETELQDNHYVVEFDPENGAVYAVWYWEKESFNYGDDAYSRAKPDRESRLQAGVEVGYYGGSYVNRVKIGQMPFPQVTLVNAEELVLLVTVPACDADVLDSNIFVTVSVNGTELPLGPSGGENARNLWKEYTGAVALDTLKSGGYVADTKPDGWKVGKAFRGWNIAGVAPGEDLKIRVTLSYKGGEYTPQSIYVTGNSLFAARDGDTASVAYGRHLQNLDPAVSGVRGITEAVQTADIDFESHAADSLESWLDTYSDMAFKPIRNTDLAGYDGDWHTVRNLTTAETEDAGVFAEAKAGFEVRGLTLIDAKVAGKETAGALVGRAEGKLTVDNCGAYITDPETNWAARTVVSAGCAGGLVGLAAGELAVTNSFASVPVNGTTVGGLVGRAEKELAVKSAYAAGILTGTSVDSLVGGLVGASDGQITLKNSYAAGVIVSGGTVGGLTPAASVAVEDTAGGVSTYAAVVYGKSLRGTAATATVYGAYPDGGTESVKYVQQGGVSFVSNSGVGTLQATETELGTARPYHLTDETALLADTYPYGRVVRGKNGELLPHYGDWLENQVKSTELVYVEWYDTDGAGGADAVGLYSVKIDGDGADVIRNSLRGDDAVVTRDGYWLISTLTPTEIGGTTPEEDTELISLLPDGFTAFKIDNENASHDIYKALAVTDSEGEKSFIYNPDFACEAFDITDAPGTPRTALLDKPDVARDGKATSGAVVRTARHLAEVSEYTREVPDATGWSFTQLLNVNYETYEQTASGGAFEIGKSDTQRQTPAQLGTGGKYDGRGHLVKNVWIGEDGGHSGLFGSVNGGAVVQDLVLVNVDAAGSGDTGALAGYFGSGTVTGCGVYCEEEADYNRYTITSGGTAGGLVGVIDGGSVSRSFAAVKVSGTDFAGGFAGRIERGRVTNCYAGGHTESGVHAGTGVNVTSDGAVGGFVGENTSGTFSGVNYSTCSVGCGDPDALGLFAGQGDDISKGADTDCLYSAGTAFVKETDGSYTPAAPRTETYLLTGAALPGGNSITAENTFNYDSAYDGESYPYLSRLDAHHGDWTVPKTTGIFYWELEDGKYNFYSFTWDGAKAAVEDGLCRKHTCTNQVEDWGYGVFGMAGTNGDETAHALAALKEFQADRPAAAQAYTLAKNEDSIDVVTGSGAKTLVCDTRFGAAIAEKEKKSELRREVRAFDQLENAAGHGALKFYQTHDIDAEGRTRPALSLSAGGLYDGGFYRILNLNIDGGIAVGAALFDAVTNATVRGVILYAPKGDGEITGRNAAGIAVKLTDGTVDSCVVAGYTVSGTGNLGGLVAEADGTSAVANSEATVALESIDPSANIGGLVGSVTGTLTVSRSYAGGSVDTGAATAASVGGIVGAGSAATYSDVYSYLDMTSAKGIKVYGIGPGAVDAGSRVSEYWYAALPASASSVNKPVDTEDRDTAGILGVTLAQLMSDTQRLGFAVEELYVPGDPDGLRNQITYADSNDTKKFEKFPFAAFVTDTADGGRNLHYGAVPSSAYAGLFYYEKELITRSVNGTEITETVYSYYAYGGEIYKNAMRGEKLLDGLCYDHHLNGERARIVETGYGYFYPAEGDMSYTLTVGGASASGTELADTDPIKTNLTKALSTRGAYKVFIPEKPEPSEQFKMQKWTLTATRNSDSAEVGKTEMYVCPAFGGVITDNEKIGENSGNDKPENYLHIRTVEQLKNYAAIGANLKYFAISHDIDMKDIDWTPEEAKGSVLDGRGCRILDLNVTATGEAALFDTTEANMTIKNVILYSPDGSGKISGETAAGIIANAAGKLTVSNCVVSGYTITGTECVGGIVGNCGTTTTIEKCQTDVILTGKAASAGGIAGLAKKETTIKECVSGGQIYRVGINTYVGGIFGQINSGKGDTVTVANCYTYMDLIESGSNNVYPIGSPTKGTLNLIGDVSYLESMMPRGYNEAGQGNAFTIESFPGKDTPDTTGAQYTFVPNDGDPFDGLAHETMEEQCYHYLTYVTVRLEPGLDTGVDASGDYRVHYGEWPGTPQVTGVMYWEIDEGNHFTYHLMGLHLTGERADLRGGICIDRHVGEDGAIERHKIVSSGYALVNMDTAKFPDVTELAGLTEGTAPGRDVEALIKDALGITSAASANPLIKVYPTPTEGDVSRAYSLELESSGVDTRVYYTKGFAEVSTHAFGTSDQSTGQVYSYYLRTARQLDNIPDNVPPTVSFVMDHDIDGEGHTGYTGAVDFCGKLDGQGFKVLDLNMSTGDDVGVLASTGAGSRISNVVVYSTAAVNASAGDGDATLRGRNVGGLVGRATGRTTIENCASAGHIITGDGSLGGLVGRCDGILIVEDCEAASFITFTGQTGAVTAGGLLGGRGADAQVTVSNSYAGGKILTPARASGCVAGGMVGGSGGSVSVSDSYSYANLLDATMGDVYAVGQGVSLGGSVQYLEPYVAGTVKTDGQGEGTGVFQLSEGGAGARADWSYNAGETPVEEGNNGYHFRAVLTVNGRLEHYGSWPTLAGLMYWEISKIDGKNTFKYHFMGLDEFGNENDFSTLCHDHHTTADGQIEEHMILTSGYALINTCGSGANITDNTNGRAVSVLTYGSGQFDEIETTDPVASEALHTMIDLMGFTPEKIGLTKVCNNTDQNATAFSVTVTIARKSKTVYCTYGLAEVAESPFGTDANPYMIRTRQQLANIDTTAHLTSGRSYRQDHDIYGHATDDPAKSDEENAFRPIGASTKAGFKGTFDGRGYRILELNILGVNNHAALFYTTDASTVKNVILYSPSGKAWIKVQYDSNGDKDSMNAGGISADSAANATISNCVVAGYTITVEGDTGSAKSHDHYLGGIGAWFRGTVTNCQVIVTLDDSAGGGGGGRAFIGGIVGGTNGTAITNCIAGGLVNRTSETTGKDTVTQYVGGLVGSQESNAGGAITNCYSYMDMSDLIGDSSLTCNLYSITTMDDDSPIHDANAIFNITDCYYWKGGIYGAEVKRGDTNDTKGNGAYTRKVTGVTLAELETLASAGGALSNAFSPVTDAATFVPENVKHLDGHAFPFGTTTVEVSGTSTPVHYGMWPEESPAVGAAYVEYEIPYGADETAGHLRYQGFGWSIADTSHTAVAYDNLCGSYGGGDTNQSGFVYFWLNDRVGTGSVPTDITGFEKLEDADSFVTQIKDSLRSIFGKNYNVAVFKSVDSGYTGNNVTWTVVDQDQGKTRELKVTFDPRFAGMYKAGDEADGSESRPYIIRNAAQLRSIDGKKDMYFEQTHDIECVGFTGFTPMTVSGIHYNGHVYSIRNLAIDGASGDTALFAGVTDSEFTGLVLDAPQADNEQSALRITTTGAVAAGLAAETNGTCAFTRCAVAGYDITSHGTTGGLVGINHGVLTVSQCEAVYNPMGTGNGDLTTIGGLVGDNRGTLTVSNSYAGGKIFDMKATEYHVGGLVGLSSGPITIKNAYTYMDMSELTHDGEKKLVYAIAPAGVDWETCRYIARGLPAWTAWERSGGEWVMSDSLGYGHGLTLFDSVVSGTKDGKEGEYTVATSLGTWLRQQQDEDGWEIGEASNRSRADFPFMAVVTDDDGEYVHFGHSRYASFGTRPYIGFFQVYGTGGEEARLNPSQGPYYGFGWIRSEEGLIGATIPNDTPDTADDKSAFSDEDLTNLGNITRTEDGVKSFLTHRATSYGLLLPKGYTIVDTGVTAEKEHSDKEYDRYSDGTTTQYLPWVEHNYCVYGTNGNIIIGDFAVEAKDGKPFEIETRDMPAGSGSLAADPGSVKGRYDILSGEVSKVKLENEAAFANYDLYWFTTASISGLYDQESDNVSRSRSEFWLKFTFNSAEETVYTLPDPSNGDYPMTHDLIVVSLSGKA